MVDLVAGVEDSGRGGRGGFAGEDELDLFGAAQVQVVGDQCLDEPAGPARVIEHQGAGGLDLAHRQPPPVAGVPVGSIQRQRQPV